MKMYYASILDHQGTEVMSLKFTATAKHSAFLATEFVKHCPPAQSFKVKMIFVDASTVADLLNRQRGL
jgi:hypothetical protein